MKTKIFLLTILLSLTIDSSAQEYTHGIGFRGGYYNGITYKQFIDSNVAIEGILDSRWHGFEIVGLYEIQNDISEVNGLSWFYGFGAHIGLYEEKYVGWGDKENYTIIGIDGIIGLEYKIPEIPFTIGLDWKPAFNIIGYQRFFGDGGALSIRYVF